MRCASLSSGSPRSGSLKVVCLLILAIGVAAGSATGQITDDGVNVPMRAFVNQDGVSPGGHMRLAVVYEIPNDAHIQVNEFLFATPADDEPFQLSGQTLPATKIWDGDPVLAGKVVVVYDLAVIGTAPVGERTLKLTAGYQACTERPIYACFAPVEGNLAVAVRIVPAGTAVLPANAAVFAAGGVPKAVASAGSEPPADNTQEPGAEADMTSPAPGGGGNVPDAPAAGDGGSTGASSASGAKQSLQDSLAGKLRGALAKGSFLAFLLVFIAGFLTSFTPCVYPMIPITIGFVLGASRGRFSGFILSLFFVCGIAVVYSTLGLLAALGGIVFGAALQSPIALVVVSVVFLAMGMSMMGAFNIALPSSFQTKLQSRRQGGWIGAIIMGGVTGLVASPCVGPVLVVILAWVAQVGNPLYGFTLLLTFAFGLGVLFLFLGTFVAALPRGGAWMDSVKHIFGWIFFIIAVFYTRTLLGPNVTTIAMGIVLILMASQIGAFNPITAESGKGDRWRKGIGIVIVVFGILMVSHGVLSHYGWRTALTAGGGASPAAATRSGLAWRSDEAAALSEARSGAKPVLIDFTAEWCAACHELDRETWSDPGIQKELSRFVTLRFDMTKRDAANAALGDRWKVRGLPTVIVIDGRGNEVTRFFGFRPPEDVLPILTGAI
jgi:thioredoxin:protein disulfide reductase